MKDKDQKNIEKNEHWYDHIQKLLKSQRYQNSMIQVVKWTPNLLTSFAFAEEKLF